MSRQVTEGTGLVLFRSSASIGITADVDGLVARLRGVRDASITATEKEACERCIRAARAFFGGLQ